MFGMEKSPFAVAVKAAMEEARRRGDRRMGTEHLLLGVLRDPSGPPAGAFGVRAEAARAALDELDRAALRAIGVDPGSVADARPRRHPSLPGTALTSSARAVINQAVKATSRKTRDRTGPSALLLALLDQRHPDPVAELIDHLGVDRAAVRSRLEQAA
ncbi:Clp protease N-terminal domain-containing protein [Nonomuraea sp. NPDC050478]|jgi:ATP-dependent Clp protease ATP-binding subunit ClpA|uniref:Clp protease N-terminal domain-containing protein n=1 Tax=Nonomuraea sp. NPDC050478 TaxID=3364365 RepID=UPI0037A0379A